MTNHRVRQLLASEREEPITKKQFEVPTLTRHERVPVVTAGSLDLV